MDDDIDARSVVGLHCRRSSHRRRSARDNSIVMLLCSRFADVELLRRIKTNVPSFTLLQSARNSRAKQANEGTQHMAKAAVKKTAKKSAAKKKPAKKAAPKKSARKVVAKKAVRKGAVKKGAAKKYAARKTAAKKAPAKSPPPKKQPSSERPPSARRRSGCPSNVVRDAAADLIVSRICGPADQARLRRPEPSLIGRYCCCCCHLRGEGARTKGDVATSGPAGASGRLDQEGETGCRRPVFSHGRW